MCRWESDQQDTDSQNQPGFIGIPERADGGNHAVLFILLGEGEQDPNAQIEPVQNNIDENGQS